MDFIEGLLKVAGKSVILTVVDRFSKYAHFIALGHDRGRRAEQSCAFTPKTAGDPIRSTVTGANGGDSAHDWQRKGLGRE